MRLLFRWAVDVRPDWVFVLHRGKRNAIRVLWPYRFLRDRVLGIACAPS